PDGGSSEPTKQAQKGLPEIRNGCALERCDMRFCGTACQFLDQAWPAAAEIMISSEKCSVPASAMNRLRPLTNSMSSSCINVAETESSLQRRFIACIAASLV